MHDRVPLAPRASNDDPVYVFAILASLPFFFEFLILLLFFLISPSFPLSFFVFGVRSSSLGGGSVRCLVRPCLLLAVEGHQQAISPAARLFLHEEHSHGCRQ